MMLSDIKHRFTAYVIVGTNMIYPQFENNWLYQQIKRKI